MLITQEQHTEFQHGVVHQVAQRLGLSDPHIYSMDSLLGRIESHDLSAYQAIMQFKNTYREWFERSLDLEQTVTAGRDAEADRFRVQVRELRLQRDHQRRLLANYLDAHFPLHTS